MAIVLGPNQYNKKDNRLVRIRDTQVTADYELFEASGLRGHASGSVWRDVPTPAREGVRR